jgi:precorrin-2 dehydrogenase/sirohydrochlorin ferrochelatase
VVVGGDEEAERKVVGLLAASARVTVVSPTLTEGLRALAETHEVMHHPREYRRGDLAGALLAFATPDVESHHAEIAAEAAESNVLLNVIDHPQLCSFIAPAVVRRGPVAIAISTGGTSPALARRLREEVERTIGPEYGTAAALLGKLRTLVSARESDATERARLYGALVDSPLLEALGKGDAPAADAILARVAGPGVTLAALGITLG